MFLIYSFYCIYFNVGILLFFILNSSLNSLNLIFNLYYTSFLLFTLLYYTTFTYYTDSSTHYSSYYTKYLYKLSSNTFFCSLNNVVNIYYLSILSSSFLNKNNFCSFFQQIAQIPTPLFLKAFLNFTSNYSFT